MSCGTTNKRDYELVEPIGELTVKFVNLKWKMDDIPEESTCKFPHSAKTPSLEVSNIPVGTNAIIMEYSDENSFFLMNNGGHGKIGYALPDGTKNITIPAVSSDNSEWPNGFWLVDKHNNIFDFTGKFPTYMPPCSGGKGHQYSVTVKAVYHAPSANENSKLIAEKEKFSLGTY